MPDCPPVETSAEALWVDVSAWRKAHGLPTYGYEIHVWNQQISRSYAADYLGILHRELRKLGCDGPAETPAVGSGRARRAILSLQFGLRLVGEWG
jgi:hypothetical protein